MKNESNVSTRRLKSGAETRSLRVLTGLAVAVLLGGCVGGTSSGQSSLARIQTSSAALVSAAPSPTVARQQHTLGLRNGLVYIVGGDPSATPSVEILDPNAGTVTAGPPLITNRRSHAMVTLPDGSFLVLGGIGSAGVLSSAEILKPGASAWQPVAPMPAALYGQSATVLQDGRVLVAGGVGYTANAWLYDPSADSWTATGSLALGRMQHGAVRLPDGRVLVAGGAIAAASGGTNTAEIYDPATGAWTSAGTMAVARSDVQLTLITAGSRAGTVVVVGSGNSVEQYVPATGFSSLPSAVKSHFGGRALALADGSVLLYGDQSGELSIERLEPTAPAWAVVDAMPDSRFDAPGVELPDGRALVVGGSAFPSGGGAEFARADAFSWSAGARVPVTCEGAGATCGTISDGCGGTLACGTCGSGQVCDATNTCVAADGGSCVPTTCSATGATCGTISDGCGGTLACGTCGSGQVCDATNTCVAADAGSCVPTTCGALGLTCGTAPDGCGGTLTCGPACSTGTVTATYDPTLKAPLCASAATTCSAVTTGRASLGPEANAPNTLGSSCADGTSGTFHSDESLDAVRVVSNTGGPLSTGGAAQVEADVWAYSGYSSDLLDVFITTTPASPVWSLVGTVQAQKSGAQTLTVPLTLPGGGGGQYAVRAQFRFGGSATPCESGSYDDRDDLVFAVEGSSDSTVPTTSVTSPTSGATVSGVVTFSATASDNVGVTRVDFFVDSTLIGSDSAAPFEMYWNTSSVAVGTHTLTTRAYDAAGNVGTSAPVSVNVVDTSPPTVTLTSPVDGATVSGPVTLTADASDNYGVTKVEFYVDAALFSYDVSAPYSADWDSASVPSGPHTITVKAYDAANNSAESSITVNVCGSECSTGTVTATYDPTLKAPLCSSAATTCSAVTTGRATLGPEANAPNTLGATCADGTAGAFHSDESLDAVRVKSTGGGVLAAGGSAQVEADVWAYSGYSSDVLDVFITTTPASPVWSLVGTVQAQKSGAQTLTLPLTLPAGSGGQYAVRAQFRYGGSATPCESGSFNDRDDVVFAVSGATGGDAGVPDGGF